MLAGTVLSRSGGKSRSFSDTTSAPRWLAITCRMSSISMMPKSCRIWTDRRVAALELADNFLVLQVVNQALFLDERQQWI